MTENPCVAGSIPAWATIRLLRSSKRYFFFCKIHYNLLFFHLDCKISRIDAYANKINEEMSKSLHFYVSYPPNNTRWNWTLYTKIKILNQFRENSFVMFSNYPKIHFFVTTYCSSNSIFFKSSFNLF